MRTFPVVRFGGGVVVVFDVQRVQYDGRGRRQLDGNLGRPLVVRGVRGGLEKLDGREQGGIFDRTRHGGGHLQERDGVQRRSDGRRPVRGRGGPLDGLRRRFCGLSGSGRFGWFLRGRSGRRRTRHRLLGRQVHRWIVVGDGHVGRRLITGHQNLFQVFEIALQRLNDLLDEQVHFFVQVVVGRQVWVGIGVGVVIAGRVHHGHVRFLLLRGRRQVDVGIANRRERERVGGVKRDGGGVVVGGGHRTGDRVRRRRRVVLQMMMDLLQVVNVRGGDEHLRGRRHDGRRVIVVDGGGRRSVAAGRL